MFVFISPSLGRSHVSISGFYMDFITGPSDFFTFFFVLMDYLLVPITVPQQQHSELFCAGDMAVSVDRI